MGLILNPQIRMKKLSDRVMLYSVAPHTSIPSAPVSIHPALAVLLAMFDGTKTYEQILRAFCLLMQKDYSILTVKLIDEQLQTIRKDLLKIDRLLIETNSPGNLSPISNPISNIIPSAATTTIPSAVSRTNSETVLYTTSSTAPSVTSGILPRYNPLDLFIPCSDARVNPEDHRLDFPLTITFNVSTTCGMQCKYCYHPKYPMREHIALDRLSVLFDECVEKGCECVLLTGGDPFGRSELLDIMVMLYEKGLPYFLSTKSFLPKITCLNLKEKAGLRFIQLGLDSANPVLAAYLAGADKEFLLRTLKTVRNLQEIDVTVRLKCVLTRYNIDTLGEYLNFCRNLGVEQVQIASYTRSLWNHNDTLFPSLEQIKRAKDILHTFKAKNSGCNVFGHIASPIYYGNNLAASKGQVQEDIFEERAVCGTGRFNLPVLPNGEVTICEQLPYLPELILGNLRSQSIEELWNSDKVLNFLAPPARETFNSDTPCKTCSEDNYDKCHRVFSRCLKDCYSYYRNLHSPDIRCSLADIKLFRNV